MASISFASESLMDPMIQVKLDNIRSVKIILHKHQCFRLRATQDQKMMQIHTVDKYGGIYSESTELIDAVNILPLARFEPTTSITPPNTTPDMDATNCATETSPKKDVQVALISTTTNAVHVVYWFFFNAWHRFRSQVKA